MEIKSDVGFFVGDVTFVLSDRTYHNYWREWSELMDRAKVISDRSLEREAWSVIYSWGLGREHTLCVPNSDLSFSVVYTYGGYCVGEEEYKDNEGKVKDLTFPDFYKEDSNDVNPQMVTDFVQKVMNWKKKEEEKN